MSEFRQPHESQKSQDSHTGTDLSLSSKKFKRGELFYEGKAKNRRIEIILTPKLDEISKMLNEF